ncbi:hypothetical protein FQR65_LT09431 [Abscondita terminalis]|nr:hypothetical protein FQR65_LT09431 [Abscondita terminalis]
MSDEPVVTIENGSLQGKIKTDYEGNTYYSFQGIPYAKPPVGDLRFKAPQPPDSWAGVKNATKEGNSCYSKHMIFRNYVGSEDCLYLNVYTRSLSSSGDVSKPVMFWIHGGGFTMGSADTDFYGPDYLITEDVVLVTINYRLGILGLFHNAILQSGTALSLWARGQNATSAVAKALGKEDAKDIDLYNILNKMTTSEVLELQEKIPDPFEANFPRILSPVVENKNAKEPFLTEEPLEVIRSGKYNHVPILIGFTSREGILSEIDSKRQHGEVRFTTNFEQTIPHDIKIPKNSECTKHLGDKIKKFYYGTEEPGFDNMDQYYLLQGDIFFVYSAYSAIKHHNLTATKPIYLYRMSVESKLNVYKRFAQVTSHGTCHGDDLGYLFTNSLSAPLIKNSVEYQSMKRCVKLWTTFAKTGNPNPTKEDNFINIVWKPVETGKHNYLEIGDHLTVGVNPEHERMIFWDEVYTGNPHKCNL